PFSMVRSSIGFRRGGCPARRSRSPTPDPSGGRLKVLPKSADISLRLVPGGLRWISSRRSRGRGGRYRFVHARGNSMNRPRFAMAMFTFALVTAFAAAASATPSAGTLEISGGYAKSSLEAASPFTTDSPSGGLAFGAGYFRNLAPKTQWGLQASYDNPCSLDWNDRPGAHTTPIHMIRFSPEFRMNFGAMVGPSFYGQAGAGYYSVSVKDEDTTLSTNATTSDGKFGFNFGAGVGFPMGPKTKLNVMGNYHSVSTSGQSTHYFRGRAGIGLSM